MYTSVKSRATAAYRQIRVETVVDTASPHHLVEMLYEGVLESLGSAKQALSRKDIPGKCEALSKATTLIEEGLKTGLNLDQGGDIARNLLGLYDFCTLRLTQANLKNDVAMIDEVTGIMETLAKAWREIKPQVEGSPS